MYLMCRKSDWHIVSETIKKEAFLPPLLIQSDPEFLFLHPLHHCSGKLTTVGASQNGAELIANLGTIHVGLEGVAPDHARSDEKLAALFPTFFLAIHQISVDRNQRLVVVVLVSAKTIHLGDKELATFDVLFEFNLEEVDELERQFFGRSGSRNDSRSSLSLGEVESFQNRGENGNLAFDGDGLASDGQSDLRHES